MLCRRPIDEIQSLILKEHVHAGNIMFFLLHIFLMGSATLGMIAGASAAVFFRKKRNWMKIHKFVNLISLAGATAGMIMAFIYVAGSSGRHLDGLHQMAGLATFVTALITAGAGLYQFKAKNKSAIRTLHRWLGRLALLAFAATVVLGLNLINII